MVCYIRCKSRTRKAKSKYQNDPGAPGQKSKKKNIGHSCRPGDTAGSRHICRSFDLKPLFLDFDLWFCILIFNL
jgi:hypothetical protein